MALRIIERNGEGAVTDLARPHSWQLAEGSYLVTEIPDHLVAWFEAATFELDLAIEALERVEKDAIDRHGLRDQPDAQLIPERVRAHNERLAAAHPGELE